MVAADVDAGAVGRKLAVDEVRGRKIWMLRRHLHEFFRQLLQADRRATADIENPAMAFRRCRRQDERLGHVIHVGEVTQLRAALDLGPAAYGWKDDQRWTLARIAVLTRRLFHVPYTLRGVSYLLHRTGFSWQVPAHRAVERDEDAIAAWRARTWAKARG